MMFDQGPYFLIYTRDSDNDEPEYAEKKVFKADEMEDQVLEKEEQGSKDIKPLEGNGGLINVDTSEEDKKGDDDLKVYM